MNKLILMVGVSGSGKTTYSKDFVSLFPHFVRLSTDECRAIVGVGEHDQTVSHKVFASIYLMTEHLLRQGKSVIIDATNYCKKHRKPFLEMADEIGAETEAIIIGSDLTFNQIQERNLGRKERQVPKEIIIRQLDGFQNPTHEEGFNYIKKVLKEHI